MSRDVSSDRESVNQMDAERQAELARKFEQIGHIVDQLRSDPRLKPYADALEKVSLDTLAAVVYELTVRERRIAELRQSQDLDAGKPATGKPKWFLLDSLRLENDLNKPASDRDNSPTPFRESS